MKAIIIGSQKDNIVKAQCEPFFYSQKQLLKELGLKIKYIPAETFQEIKIILNQELADVIFMIPFWGEDANEVIRILQEIRTNQPARKLIFIDPWAQTTSRYFGVLPYVDWFVKRQRYCNLDLYQKKFIGGSLLTDYLAKEWQLDLADWFVGSEIPDNCQHKIIAGWNLGTAKKFRDQLMPNFFISFYPLKNLKTEKDIDIFCRLSLGSNNKKEWYYQYRARAVEATKSINSSYQVAGSAGFVEKGLVPRKQYESELQRSKIVFSPFGWGETCWRDFEAICNNSLLIKPDMSHIETYPDIFQGKETYIPVKWDLSDLAEKCYFYLENQEERERIVKQARQVYLNYFQENHFVKLIKKMLT